MDEGKAKEKLKYKIIFEKDTIIYKCPEPKNIRSVKLPLTKLS